MEGTVGEIRLFAGTFAPLSWAFCNGSSMSIAEYTTLYAVIGNTFGGDGVTNFNLPDLQSRTAIGTGQGPGLKAVQLGEAGGAESVTMTIAQMPTHSHTGAATISIQAYSGAGDTGSPTGAVLAGLTGAYSTEPADTNLAAESATIPLTVAGSGQPFSIIQPYSASNYIICTEGIYPSRS